MESRAGANTCPSEDEQFDDLPPEAWADPPGPPSTGNPAESAVADSAATDGPSYLRPVDGSAAVPDPPPVAVGVNASPAASAGAPTPPPGEASLSPAEGRPGATGTGPQAQDAAPPATPAPANAEAVQTSASPPPEEAETEDEESEQIAPTVLAFRWFHAKLELNGVGPGEVKSQARTASKNLRRSWACARHLARTRSGCGRCQTCSR